MQSWNKLKSAKEGQLAKNEGNKDVDAVNETKGTENKSTVDEDEDAVTEDEDIMDWGVTDDRQ